MLLVIVSTRLAARIRVARGCGWSLNDTFGNRLAELDTWDSDLRPNIKSLINVGDYVGVKELATRDSNRREHTTINLRVCNIVPRINAHIKIDVLVERVEEPLDLVERVHTDGLQVAVREGRGNTVVLIKVVVGDGITILLISLLTRWLSWLVETNDKSWHFCVECGGCCLGVHPEIDGRVEGIDTRVEVLLANHKGREPRNVGLERTHLATFHVRLVGNEDIIESVEVRIEIADAESVVRIRLIRTRLHTHVD
jgi:hypothetical protein